MQRILLAVGALLLAAGNVRAAKPYPDCSSASADPYERKAAEIHEAIGLIATGLTGVTGDHPPPQSLLDHVSDLEAAMRFMKNAADMSRHDFPPPNLASLTRLCDELDKIDPEERFRLAKLEAEFNDLWDQAQKLTDVRNESDYWRKHITAQATANIIDQTIRKAIDVTKGAFKPEEIPDILADWCNEMAQNNPSKLHLPKGPFVSRNEAEIRARLRTFLRSSQYWSKKQKIWADIIGRIKSGTPVASLSRLQTQEFEIIVKKYHEIIARLAKEQIDVLADKMKRKRDEINRRDILKKQVLGNLRLFKQICARIAALPTWQVARVRVPDLIGQPEADARRDVADVNLRVGTVRYTHHATTPTGRVCAQDPVAHTPVNAQSEVRLVVSTGPQPTAAQVPDVVGMTRGRAVIAITGANLTVGTVEQRFRRGPIGVVLEQHPDAGTWVAGQSPVHLVISKGTKAKLLYLDPPRSTIQVGDRVTFAVLLILDDGTEQVLRPTDVKWDPGPRHVFTATRPGTYIITAEYVVPADVSAERQVVTGTATVTVEEDWSVPPGRAVSRADDVGADVLPAPPEEYQWYAFCSTAVGEVSFGRDRPGLRPGHRTGADLGLQVMAGPFPGPRTARAWIEENCPRWRCTTTGLCADDPARGGDRYVVCNIEDGTVSITLGRPADPRRFSILDGPFLSLNDANFWIEQNCPSRRCTSRGVCSGAPTPGDGDHYVVCSREHGAVGITRHPDPARFWVWEGPFWAPDARRWIERNCPTWRCDANGRCLPGTSRIGTDRPLELPPDLDALADGWDDALGPDDVGPDAFGEPDDLLSPDDFVGMSPDEYDQHVRQTQLPDMAPLPEADAKRVPTPRESEGEYQEEYQAGRRIGEMLADALGDKLIEEADRGRARRAARRTTPSAESPSDSSAPSARARSADAFVGSWRGTWRFQQHSQSNDWPDDMPRQVTFTLTIARAGQGYTARGLEFDVEQVSVAGDTITIRGQSPYTLQIRGRGAKDYHGHHPETVRLTLKEGGRVLEGTWRTDSDPKRSDKWWQIGAVRATKL